jgi:hypothetical protein
MTIACLILILWWCSSAYGSSVAQFRKYTPKHELVPSALLPAVWPGQVLPWLIRAFAVSCTNISVVIGLIYDGFVQFENLKVCQGRGLKHPRYHCANRNPGSGLPGSSRGTL